jgi:uncharacterized oligopeptide transporter (OPT) family protein
MQNEATRGADQPEPADKTETASLAWLRDVYQGESVRQLSARSLIAGMVIGGVMSISNLYVGLKTGWGLGVTITSCIIAYAVFKALEAVIPAYRNDPFTILENYTMSSAASAAGYTASAGLVSAVPALYLTTGRWLEWWELMLWIGALSALGLFLAIPLKRQLINVEQLPFPEGVATAETLKSIHTAGSEAMSKARALFCAGGVGALLAVWRDAWPALSAWIGRLRGDAALHEKLAGWAFPSEIPLIPGRKDWKLTEITHGWLERYTIGFEGSAVMIAAGAIMGIRIGLSLLLGAILFYGILAPLLISEGIAEPGYRGIVAWTVWPATAMMVTSGLLSFGMRWRTIVRAFKGLASALGSRTTDDDPLAHIEVPMIWFVGGTFVFGTACVFLGHWLFGISWWMGILAVLLTFVLSIVAARATGETSITPIGAMGKITQLFYGAIAPSSPTVNLMTASITAGASSHSADLLSDLKSGYMLGGNPRKQTISQFCGVIAGVLICVPIFSIVVKKEDLKSTDQRVRLPAPAARVWEAVARLMTDVDAEPAPPGAAQPAHASRKGRSIKEKLPKYALHAILIGAFAGILLTLADEFAPPQVKRWLPSSTGLGIAGVVPAWNSISMFLGALAAWLFARWRPATAERYVIPVSSGLIAGESLAASLINLWDRAPALWNDLKGALFGKK